MSTKPKPIFLYKDYRRYLADRMDAAPNQGRGQRSQLARAMQCHTAYLSRILAGSAEIGLEQALRANVFFRHGAAESDYFLLLVQYQRSGTKELKAYFARKLDELRDQHLNLDSRLPMVNTVTAAWRSIYYSHWHYAALHVATAIPRLQTIPALTEYFAMATADVQRVLDVLVAAGLVTATNGHYRIANTHIHVYGDEALSRAHHLNGRLLAITSFDKRRPSDIHYSSTIACSQEDLPRIRDVLASAIESVRAIVKNSPEEIVAYYAVDAFDLQVR